MHPSRHPHLTTFLSCFLNKKRLLLAISSNSVTSPSFSSFEGEPPLYI